MDLFTPVLRVASMPFVEMASFFSNVSGLAELQAENTMLRQENVRLREWYQTALMLQAEIQSLQELLNLKLEPQYRYITTRVISDAGNAFVKSILVGAGETDGVQKGHAVLAGEGMIGRVIESSRNAARVLLVSDYNSRIPVIIEGSRQRAILSGMNDDLPILKYLPPDSKVEEGMRVVTSGHGRLFPPGLPVGKVVLDKHGQPAVELFADVDKIVYVRVLEAPADPNLLPGDQQKELP